MTPLAQPGGSTIRKFRSFDSTFMYDEGTERARVIFTLLERHGIRVTSGSLLDLGCGFGGFSLHAARRGVNVTGVDSDAYRLHVVRERALAEGIAEHGQLSLLRGTATDLPFRDATFDHVLTVGVLEWIPLVAGRRGDPREVQLGALKEISRVTKPGGQYILATKNRWHPPFLLREPQTKWPLVNHLPRRAAQIVSHIAYGHAYRTYIHSLSGWHKLLREASFSSVQTYLPVYGYQFPAGLWNAEERGHDLEATFAEASAWISPEFLRRTEGRHARLKRPLWSLLVRGGLERQLWQGFIFVARR